MRRPHPTPLQVKRMLPERARAGRLRAVLVAVALLAGALVGTSASRATITPFGGNEGYDDADGLREATRQAVNAWIRTSGRFDAVIDFDRVSRDPADPRRLHPAYDTGDHLHLNQVGYKALADAVPARLFESKPLPPNFTFN